MNYRYKPVTLADLNGFYTTILASGHGVKTNGIRRLEQFLEIDGKTGATVTGFRVVEVPSNKILASGTSLEGMLDFYNSFSV